MQNLYFTEHIRDERFVQYEFNFGDESDDIYLGRQYLPGETQKRRPKSGIFFSMAQMHNTDLYLSSGINTQK